MTDNHYNGKCKESENINETINCSSIIIQQDQNGTNRSQITRKQQNNINIHTPINRSFVKNCNYGQQHISGQQINHVYDVNSYNNNVLMRFGQTTRSGICRLYIYNV